MSTDMRGRLLRALQPIGRRWPAVLGLGRLLGLRRWAKDAGRVTIFLDGDITLELDLAVRGHRYFYYVYDLNCAHELSLIRRLVDADTVFVDVGANMGAWSLAAARRARQVIAFEPGADSLARLRRNLELNPNLARKVVVKPCAIGAAKGEVELHVDADQPEQASLADVGGAVEHVPVETLDDALDAETLPAGTTLLLKLDVEGAEMAALRGGERVIAAWRPIVLCELFEPHQRRHGASCADILAFFQDRGYAALLARDGPGPADCRLDDLRLAVLSGTEVNTGLFIPRERLDVTARALGRV